MISCKDFSSICRNNDFTFFTGVPDSTFKSWINFLNYDNSNIINVPAVNECEAISICAGYYLSTKKIGIVYMQNSGLAKSVDPLTSLCNKEVYSIPILLIIGWRGEPKKLDAFQHYKMGQITLPLLRLLKIPFKILTSNLTKVNKVIKNAKEYMEKNKQPFAIIVKKGLFEEAEVKTINNEILMTREEAILSILKCLHNKEIIISNTGKTSRELFEYRRLQKQGSKYDFYNVGAMGCAQSIALGIAIGRKDRKVIVLDGDGSLLMDMGPIATKGYCLPKNFYHIVIDNQSYDSTGGQPTISKIVNFDKVALACNYRHAYVVKEKNALIKAIKDFKNKNGPFMLVIKVKKGSRSNLGRITKKLKELKESFMNNLGVLE